MGRIPANFGGPLPDQRDEGRSTSAARPGALVEDRRVPEGPAHRAAALRALGYHLMGAAESCIVRLTGEGEWLLKLGQRPIKVDALDGRQRPAPAAEVTLESPGWAIARFAADTEFGGADPGQSGLVKVSGAPAAVARVEKRLGYRYKSVGRYAAWADLIDDSRFVFMNLGFSRPASWKERLKEFLGELGLSPFSSTPRCDEDFSWIQDGDQEWCYAVNLVRRVVEDVALEDRDVLDVGCGRGGMCSYLARYHRPRRVWGVDYCEGNIAFCRRTHSFPNVSFEAGDAQALPFPDGSFDVVTNVESSHNYRDLGRFREEVRRVLRPGGVFCYADALPREKFKILEQLGDGGEIQRLEDITAGVLRATLLNAPRFEQLMTQMIREDAGNELLIRQMIEAISSLGARRQELRKKGMTYWLFQVALETSRRP
jgi:O-methyltransferase